VVDRHCVNAHGAHWRKVTQVAKPAGSNYPRSEFLPQRVAVRLAHVVVPMMFMFMCTQPSSPVAPAKSTSHRPAPVPAPRPKTTRPKSKRRRHPVRGQTTSAAGCRCQSRQIVHLAVHQRRWSPKPSARRRSGQRVFDACPRPTGRDSSSSLRAECRSNSTGMVHPRQSCAR
jgi:hypothetical protein